MGATAAAAAARAAGDMAPFMSIGVEARETAWETSETGSMRRAADVATRASVTTARKDDDAMAT